MKQTMETTRKSDKVPTPTVMGLSTPQANTFPFVNCIYQFRIQLLLSFDEHGLILIETVTCDNVRKSTL